jgi:glycosyltransferase involved in cell wall biosynthesis
MKKLAIITSHPIQYNAPLFRLLTERKNVQLKVFYTWGQTKDGFVYDPDFKKEFKWDIPLLDGYEKEFVENVSPNPGADHFKGIQNKNLIQLIESYNPDALLVYGWSFQSHLQVLRYFKGKKKILFRGDSNLLDEPDGFSFKKIVRRIFLKWVYSYIDVALYTGIANKNYYLKHGIKNHQLIYAPHAVENERFYDDSFKTYSEKAKEWKLQLGISPESLVFLFAGKWEPKKNPFLLLEAFRLIQNKSIRLILVGNGILEKQVKEVANLDDRIILLGFQNQQLMPVVYRLGDVFVLPSDGPGETWGLSVNEAMACGRPVIVSNKCGCAAELVKGNGFVFQTKNKEQLVQAMLSFVEERDQYHLKSLKSETIIKEFSQKKIAESIERLL